MPSRRTAIREGASGLHAASCKGRGTACRSAWWGRGEGEGLGMGKGEVGWWVGER